MIIFVHIPKCAGTSFVKMFESNFIKKFQHAYEIQDWSRNNKNIYEAFLNNEKVELNPDFCHSHFCHGFHRLFDTNDYKYITFLREPISRTISAIRFQAARIPNTENPGIFSDSVFSDIYNKFYVSQNDSAKFINALIENNIMCNQMTKQLSGVVDLKRISLSKELQSDANWFPPYYHELYSYSDQEMEDMLEKAIENLSKYYFVGIQEEMKLSIDRFKEKFPKFKFEKPTHKHKSTIKKYFTWKNDHEYELIKDMNRYDIKLYDAAKEMI